MPNDQPNARGSFPFYRLPKELLEAGELSLEAAALYALLLDRWELSAKNGWADAGGVFVYFTQAEAQRVLRCGHNRATAFMRELERCGLIRRKRQGQGKPAKIYVRDLSARDGSAPADAENAARPALFSAPEEAVRTASGGRPETPGKGRPDCPERAGNKTEKNQTQRNETHRIHPRPLRARREAGRRMDQMGWVRKKLRENIDYEGLVWDHPGDQGLYDGYVELMAEAVCAGGDAVRIGRNVLPAAAVRRRLWTLNREHIEYVRDCLCAATAPIANIKAYTLAALYNAPATMEQYYAALASRDLGLPPA